MTRTNLRSISIAPDHNKSQLSKGQKAFNTLIKQMAASNVNCNTCFV
jgi:hypothetical protein